MKTTKISEIMTCKPELIDPGATVRDAAIRMKDIDCGVLPVGSGEDVIGMITDRDITLRAVAEGREGAKTLVRDIMTKGAYTIDEDTELEEAAAEMHRRHVGRLVVTHHKKVTGIVTMGELLRNVGETRQGQRVLRELAGA
jgi:CBS domain-containing protein